LDKLDYREGGVHLLKDGVDTEGNRDAKHSVQLHYFSTKLVNKRTHMELTKLGIDRIQDIVLEYIGIELKEQEIRSWYNHIPNSIKIEAEIQGFNDNDWEYMFTDWLDLIYKDNLFSDALFSLICKKSDITMDDDEKKKELNRKFSFYMSVKYSDKMAELLNLIPNESDLMFMDIDENLCKELQHFVYPQTI
jgi:hypothetical protein